MRGPQYDNAARIATIIKLTKKVDIDSRGNPYVVLDARLRFCGSLHRDFGLDSSAVGLRRLLSLFQSPLRNVFEVIEWPESITIFERVSP